MIYTSWENCRKPPKSKLNRFFISRLFFGVKNPTRAATTYLWERDFEVARPIDCHVSRLSCEQDFEVARPILTDLK